MAAGPRPHDLLRLRHGGVLDDAQGPAPGWVAAALERSPTVVVRRACRSDDRVPVGVRGAERQQRHGTWVATAEVATATSPEDLANRLAGGCPAPAPVAALLQDLERELPGVAWGPVGSVGFELATGVHAVRATSDLDLLVRAHAPGLHDWAALADLLDRLAEHHGRHVDCQVDTGLGGVHLDELPDRRSEVLLRTDAGPLLVRDPWDAAAALPW